MVSVVLVRTHPLWRPYELPDDEEIARARIHPHTAELVKVVPSDPAWPAWFSRVGVRIAACLGPLVVRIEHVGSTSVPGLWAKPVIDVDLVVPDSADESVYAPAMEAAGFELRVREPEWEQHRLFRGTDPEANVHVFSPAAQEPRRHRLFRDWLTTHAEDCDAYGNLKRSLAQQEFSDVMHYNNAKASLIYDIYERIFLADPANEHDPHPRNFDNS
jgi:GrpB-like predicted nucleotidyltransferase (UPF0157 family)